MSIVREVLPYAAAVAGAALPFYAYAPVMGRSSLAQYVSEMSDFWRGVATGGLLAGMFIGAYVSFNAAKCLMQ